MNRRAGLCLLMPVVVAMMMTSCMSLPTPKVLTPEEAALREKGRALFAPARAEYLETEDPALQAKALQGILEAAKMNCPEAMYFFGHHYLRKSDPTPEEVTLAVEWIGSAATEDYPPAMSAMGIIYMQGFGVRTSTTSALKLFHRAAAFGDPFAMYNLGVMYFGGVGVVQNFDKASRWFERAIKKGDLRSHTYLGKLYLFGRGVLQNVSTARKHFLTAAEHGDGEAMTLLGALYKTGTGVDKDLAKAKEWFEKAMAAGYEPARERLKEIQL